jgi:CRISPR-associated protein Cmr6
MYVAPNYQSNLLLAAKKANFGLFFFRMTQWGIQGPSIKAEFLVKTEQTNQGPKQIMDSSIVELGQRGTTLLPLASDALGCVHKRQKRLVGEAQARGDLALEVRARLASPFVSGLGSGHPTETGMILDRNTGMPYIPASAIKGVLRLAHAVNISRSGQAGEWIRNGVVDHKGRFKPSPDGDQTELSDREPSLRKYFGDTDTAVADGVRGQLVFLDAFPESPPSLKADIMNPHFHKYYGENQPPVDCEDPIPVKFLSVEPGTVFVFRVLAAPLAAPGEKEKDPVDRKFGPEDESLVRAMFSTAFDELGFGGKTSVGYGRFQGLDASARQSETPSSGAPSAAQPSQSPAAPAPKKDPDAQRQEEVAVFKSALPRPDALAGQIDSLLGTIRAKEDAETRKLCCRALLDLARSNKKKFNSAVKDKKAWAVKLTDLCAELGVAVT